MVESLQDYRVDSSVATSGIGRTGAVCLVAACVFLLVSGTSLNAQEMSLRERWEETLRYGIDSDVQGILSQIEQAGETGMDDLIIARFDRTRSHSARRTIIEHFSSRESDAIADSVRSLLLSFDQLNDDLLRVSTTYLSRIVHDDSPQLLDRYAEIAEDSSLLAATVAVDAIGRNASTRAVELLLDLYERMRTTDMRSAIIRALGETGSEAGVPLLITIASDEFEESSLRQYAAESLGKIGAPEALPVLTELLSDDDSVLRAYATGGLGYFDTDESAALLEEALRDSFWRVRVAALGALGEQGRATSLPAVSYMARRDPERPVRLEAIRVLGRLGIDASIEALRGLAHSVSLAETERILTIELLARHDSGANAELFTELADAEWSRENSRILDAIGRGVSEHPSARLAGLYSKLLSHPNHIIRVYAIRGIGGARLHDGIEELKRIASDNPDGLVRRSALIALESMGVAYDPETSDEPETDSEAAGGAGTTPVPAPQAGPEDW